MHHRSTARTVVVAGLGAALALPGAALAQTFDHRDPAHDVQHYHASDGTVSNAPHNKTADITRTRLTYTKHHLESTIWVRSGSIPDSWLMAGTIHTTSDSYSWFGSTDSTGTAVFSLEDSSGTVTCDFSHDVAKAKGRITVTIPSSCLSKPRWVKAGAAYALSKKNNDQLADDGLQKRGLTANATLALSPKLHHA
jgi:hypothetical protein